MNLSRRDLLRYAAIGAGVGAGSVIAAPVAAAAPVRGRLLDYAGGVPTAAAIRAAGYRGAIRYVSQRRPGAENWMLGKPFTRAEAQGLQQAGLEIVSCYQFGSSNDPDWKGGALAGTHHAGLGLQLHEAAGGPVGNGCPIYVCIDSSPTLEQFNTRISPYLRAWDAALRARGMKLGVYANYYTVAWCREDGIGSYFWMHDWGSDGRLHPDAQIHQLPVRRQVTVGGVVCDANDVIKDDYGQWSRFGAGTGAGGSAPGGTTPRPPAAPGQPLPPLPSLDDLRRFGVPDPSRYLELLNRVIALS